jgi:two-component system chemotaxis sensor kinase CheA
VNIRHQISVLVVASLLALLSIGGYAIWQSSANANAVRSVTEGAVPSAMASADLVSALKDVQLATMNLLAAADERLQGQARDQLVQGEQRLKSQLALQQHMAAGEVQRGLVAQAQDVLDNYFTAINDTAKFKQSGQTALASATFAAGVLQYQDNLQQIVDTLRVEKNRAKDSAILTLNRSLSATATTLLLLTVSMLLLLSLLGGMLYRRIVRPISKMQSMMSQIADSQDFSRRVPVGREDEIGKSIVAFNRMIARIEDSTVLLTRKTSDIQSMLQHIPQGILTIIDGALVHHEYSAHLETILETHCIAGQSVMDLLFSQSSLQADGLSQVEATLHSCIGEDRMNYDFNQHLLPGELEKHLPDGRVKVLDLNWSAITDEHGCVERLMLCVRDVTELRALAAEANKQKRELAIIGEILAVSQEKFLGFITEALRFIGDNDSLIRQHPHGGSEVLAQLFRNMHTVKGNARTYGLSNLTNGIHLAEQTYAELQKPKPDIAWDQTQLLTELAAVRESIEHYARVNEVSLGRKGAVGGAGTERYLLVDRDQIRETLTRLENVNTGNLHELIAVRDAVHRVLNLMGTEALDQTLSGVLASLPSLASELGKEAPEVVIEQSGYVLRNQVGGMLKNVFVHLLRNALAHGLEAADERRALGKPVRGTLRIRQQMGSGKFELSLQDDGRGLALGQIRQRALAHGLLPAGAHPGDMDTAMLIFRPGFSTAATVTQVSGRGAGMDAVQSFARRENCQIQLRFLDDDEGADFRRFETVIVLPEACAVPLEARPENPAGELARDTGRSSVAPAPSADALAMAQPHDAQRL